MGTDVVYGKQQYWYYGSAYDGMFKTPSGVTDFKYGQNNDFLYPNDKQVAAICIAGASINATASLTIKPNARASGQATGTVIRRIGGVSPIYDGARYYSYGLGAEGLNKKDAGQQTFWLFGGVASDLFPTTQGALVIAGALASATARLTFSVNGRSIGQATPVVVRKIGGATDPQGGEKYPSTGLATGFTFFALSNSIHTTNKSMFADQTLWYFGLPTPDMIGTAPTPPVIASPAKIISARTPTKRENARWPVSVKIIDPGMPAKKSTNT